MGSQWDVDATPNDAALEWFRAKLAMPASEFYALEESARAKAFTVSGLADLDMVSDVWDSVGRAIEKGTSMEDFVSEMSEMLEGSWGDGGSRLETVFRTNVQSALSMGRFEQNHAVKATHPFQRFDAVEDENTTDICRHLDGQLFRADDPFLLSHNPPLHFNAVPSSTMITTHEGQRRIGDMVPGIEVLTHRRRWRTVTAVLHKVSRRALLELQLSTGRVLRVTHEHPLLVHAAPNHLLWRKAGDLKVGDQVLEHGHESMRSPCALVLDADDAPALRDEPSVPLEITRASFAPLVNAAVDLDSDHLVDERQVGDEGADRVLSNGAAGEEREEVLFRWGQFLPVCQGDGARSVLGHAAHVDRVGSAHSFGAVGPTSPERPVPLAAPLGDHRGVRVGDRDLVGLRPNGDAVLAAPERQARFAQTHGALDLADAATSLPVLGANQLLKGGPVAGVEWHASTVASIAEIPFEGELCDLSVDEDESYVAGGVVVHNCRTELTAITQADADESEPGETPPLGTAPAPGFGHVTQAFKPDLSTRPPELVHLYELKQHETK